MSTSAAFTNGTTTGAAAHIPPIWEGGSPISTPLTIFLIQLLLVVLLSKLLAFFFKFIKQPPVIAEVVAGIILGPSVLGNIDGYLTTLWTSTSLVTFGVFANWGLILFMYMVGLELDTKIMRKNVTSALAISITAMICPFVLGIGASWVIHQKAGNPDTPFASFLLFVAVAMSITAFPVLARILTETKILHTKVGTLALSAAAVDDVAAWCLLAFVVAYAKADRQIDALYTFLALIGFVLFMVFIVRPFINSLAKRRRDTKIKYNIIMMLMGAIFLCSWYTEIIGVHAIFGSFVLGIVTPRRNGFAHSILERIEDLVVIILLPLYFTFSGLRTNIGSLSDALSWGLIILIITAACIGKIAGAVIAAKIVKCSWRDAFTIGVLMNTKGLVELIVLNVGLDAGVLNTRIFTMFVLMALLTTFITTPLLHFIYLRHLPKEREEVGVDTFSMILAVQQPKTAPFMVSIASIFANIKSEFTLKALFLTEISDRPSSYFFSEFYSTFQDAPLLKGKDRKGLLNKIHTTATVAGITNIETKNLASSNIPEEVKNYVESHNNSMVMFDMFHSVDMEAHRPTDFSIRASVSHAVDSGVQRVFSFGASEALLQTAIKKIQCPIGVLIRKTDSVPEKVDRILFLHTGSEQDRVALEFIETVKAPIAVTIITTGSLSIDRENIKVIVRPSPLSFSDFKDEAAQDYDLIIMAGRRDSSWDGYVSDPVQTSKLPVLLVFPPKFVQLHDVHVIASQELPTPNVGHGKYTFSEQKEEVDK